MLVKTTHSSDKVKGLLLYQMYFLLVRFNVRKACIIAFSIAPGNCCEMTVPGQKAEVSAVLMTDMDVS